MHSTIIQARFGEDTYPIGRFILDCGRVLGISRTQLVHRLGYRQIGNGHKALAELLTTGTAPPQIAKNLATALQVEEELLAAVIASTDSQRQDEASQRTLARETAYRTTFKPHLRCETARAVPEPIFIAALLTTARLRKVQVCPETWEASADDREGLLKPVIQDHYREHRGWVPAFGAIVGYTAVLLPGYRLDFGIPHDVAGDVVGSMRPVTRLGEATLGTKRGDTRLTGFFRDTPIRIVEG